VSSSAGSCVQLQMFKKKLKQKNALGWMGGWEGGRVGRGGRGFIKNFGSKKTCLLAEQEDLLSS